eukprot:scaffold6413_cov126-Skeletonema_menzelii.AAC.2
MKFKNAKYVALLAAIPFSCALASGDIVGKKNDEGLRGVRQRGLAAKTCSKEKKVSIYKFCIEGDCDSGAEGEHRLKLDGQWLWNGFRDFREGQCHSINHSAKTVAAWKSLAVGTEEHDDWSENDSYFATMTASSWYSETCETYELILAKEHTSAKKESMCWEMSAAGGAKGVDLGLTATRCTEWTTPSESFLWYLKVEPKDVSYITYPPTSPPTTASSLPPTTPPTASPASPPTPASEFAVKTCSKEKEVSIYKFCIEGDCDIGAEGEHRLKLDGQWLWNGFRDFREGQCHSINHSAKTVAAWKSLAVGTEEHDGWSENDSYFATMTASSWYSETCETYELILAKEHTSAKKESMCWEMSAAGGAKGVDLGLTATRCTEWTTPSESFLWYLKVEPKDVSYITYPPTSPPTTAPSLPPTADVPPPTPHAVSFESSLLGTSGSSHASLNVKIASLVIGLLGALVFFG